MAAGSERPTHDTRPPTLTPCDRALKAADSASAAAASLSLIPDQSLRTQTGRTGRRRGRTLRKETKAAHKHACKGPARRLASLRVAAGGDHLCRKTRAAWTDTLPSPVPAESERRWRWRGSTGSGRSGSDLLSGSGKRRGTFQNRRQR